MVKRILFLILSGLLLSGCFAESMTLVQSGIGASQGRALQSAISPTISFGVKQATGKFPIEHVIVKEKQRIAKKVSNFENKIIVNTKKSIQITKAKIVPVKNDIENKVAKFSDNLLKVKTFAENNFKHKPRFSYKVR